MSARLDPRSHAYDDQARHSGMIYVLMLVVAVAFGGFLWQLYSSPVASTVDPAAESLALEAEAGVAPNVVEEVAPAVDAEAATSAPPEVAQGEAATPAGDAALAPRFVAEGPYVAQLAALQSEAGVEPAWRRFSSRAPDLFASARLDVERADLGPRGYYYRVRAGYFSDRANAARFCERIRQLGQDCIAVAR